jgi:hypothetical protein
MVAIAGLAIVPRAIGAQTRWQSILIDQSGPIARDITHDQLVMSGRGPGSPVPGSTWVWDGASWTAPVISTTQPLGGALAFTFDGVLTFAGGLWRWNGSSWSPVPTFIAPPGRGRYAMCYDQARGCVVLFGGADSTTTRNDTWEWDGVAWRRVLTTITPLPRCEHALVFDAAHVRTLLFGGSDYNETVVIGDTWLFDGTSWQFQSGAGPPARAAHAMTHDLLRGQTVLFGGHDTTTRFGDTWEWNGAWTQASTGAGPGVRSAAFFADDPFHAGCLLVVDDGELWSWDGSTWQLVAATPARPSARSLSAAAFDSARGRVVVFGGGRGNSIPGLGELWEWDGANWSQPSAGSQPSPRYDARMAYDSARGRTVMFGGWASAVVVNETWEWDGASWTQFTGPAPAPRRHHRLVFDSGRNQIVLFGGLSANNTLLGDTWEYDGAAWRQRVGGPAPRFSHAMAFDSWRGRTVLYGGRVTLPGTLSNDTWEWDGLQWMPFAPPTGPGMRADMELVFDSRRGRTVMFGGPDASTWEWDGANWILRSTVGAPPSRTGHVLVYDDTRGQVVLCLGNSGTASDYVDLWQYGPVWPASATPYGAGCAGSSGTLALDLAPPTLPWLGDVIQLRASPLPAPGVAVFWFGLSRSSWQGLALPLALDPLGMPGCSLLAGADAVQVVVGSGSVLLPAAMSSQTALLGRTLAAQCAALDPAANAFGAVLSNGMELRAGNR